jgi:hypothetical protein
MYEALGLGTTKTTYYTNTNDLVIVYTIMRIDDAIATILLDRKSWILWGNIKDVNDARISYTIILARDYKELKSKLNSKNGNQLAHSDHVIEPLLGYAPSLSQIRYCGKDDEMRLPM